MYAVIETGGKQYRVEPGAILEIERRPVTGKKVKKVTFDRVLLLSDGQETRVGTPVVEGAQVTASLMEEIRGPKLRVFKKKRRKGYKRLHGHRQDLLRIKIDKIKA